jgi:hypothetical protein
MNTPVIAVIVAVALLIGGTLSIMNKACKTGDHVWCAPLTARHHFKVHIAT